MPKTLLFGAARELEVVIETSLMLTGRATSVPVLAKRIFEQEASLMQLLMEPWMLTRLEWLIRQKRNAIPAEGQLTLPGMPALPRFLRLKSGLRPRFASATLDQLKEYREILLKRRSPRLRIVDRMIEVMQPYAKKDRKVQVLAVVTAEWHKAQGAVS